MYKFDKAINLVTCASPFNQNLALLDVDEHLSAESLAVVHEGYVNVIPILNTSRRSKYVPFSQGNDRGKGVIKQVKWVKLQGETIFVVLSDNGMQIYDAEVTDVKFYHACREIGDNQSYTIGICVLKNEILCIGTNLGTVWMFKGNDTNTNFSVVGRFYAHDEAVSLMDGFEEYLITSSNKMTYMWIYKNGAFDIMRKLEVSGLYSAPSALKVTNCLTLVGYESGEFCIFDFFDEDFLIRTVGHKLKVTAIDFSALTNFILTGSQDCYVKIWKYRQHVTEAELLHFIFNDDGPICGSGFLNFTCTEFCVVTAENVGVKFYLRWDKEDAVDTEINCKKKDDDNKGV